MTIAWIERLRIVGAFGVVLIHCVGVAFMTLPFGSDEWKMMGFIDALVRFSLPLFFIISGALLLSKEPKDGDRVKRVLRIAPLIVVWSFVFLGLIWWKTNLGFFDLFKLFLRGEGYYHLWYLWALIPLYVVTPLIYRFLRDFSLGIALAGVIVLGSLGSSLEAVAVENHIFVHPLLKGVMYGFYFVIGGILMRYPLSKLVGGGFFIIGTGGLLIEFLASTTLDTALVAIRFSSPFVALMGVGAVTLFYHFGNKTLTQYEKKLASLTLGIYLLHPLFVTLFSTHGRFDFPVVSGVGIFICSAIVVMVLQKIKPIAKFV